MGQYINDITRQRYSTAAFLSYFILILGLETLHKLTSSSDVKLVEFRVDLKTANGTEGYALYHDFSITNASDNYRLILGPFREGNAGLFV